MANDRTEVIETEKDDEEELAKLMPPKNTNKNRTMQSKARKDTKNLLLYPPAGWPLLIDIIIA